MVKISTTERVDYSKFATPEWNLIVSFFRAYPDIMEDICEGDRAEYSNSLMNRVTKRYMARYRETFTFASRGYGKTSCLISDKCNKGILWPGEITGYYAPSEKQAAPMASKAFAGWERNVPLLAAHWRRINDSTDRFAVATINGSKFIMDIDRGIDTSGVVAEECAQEDRNPFNWTDFNQIVLGTNRLEHKASKRDIEASNARLLRDDAAHRMESLPGEIPFENYIKIDNTELAPETVAQMIRDRFGL